MSSAPLAYPWESLVTLSASDVEVERASRRGLQQLVDFRRLPEVLSGLFVASLDAAKVRSSTVTSQRRDLGASFVVRGGGLTVWLSLEPAFVVLLLRRVLGAREGLDPGTPLSIATTGAALSVIAEVCRRVARGPALEPDFSLSRGAAGASALVVAPGEQRAWAVDFYMRVDGRSFMGFAAISGAVHPRDASVAPSDGGLEATPLSLNAVVARCELDRAEFDALSVGDIVLPGDDALSAFASGTPTLANGNSVLLCSPGATRALRLHAKDGKLCLAGVTELRYDAPVSNSPAVSNSAGSTSQASSPATDVVLEAPVVVHIELGSVTLPVHEWLGLRTGDVVTSQLPIGGPVTMRVAGQAVAEGELVKVDGHVGVRIVRFYGA